MHKQLVLESVCVQFASPAFVELDESMKRVARSLPWRLHSLGEHLEHLSKLEEGVAEAQQWLDRVGERRVAEASRLEQLQFRLEVYCKEPKVCKLLDNFLLLEKKVF